MALLEEVRKFFGPFELAGTGENPLNLAWTKATDLTRVHNVVTILWNSLFTASLARHANRHLGRGRSA
jgi:hypothetical protein